MGTVVAVALVEGVVTVVASAADAVASEAEAEGLETEEASAIVVDSETEEAEGLVHLTEDTVTEEDSVVEAVVDSEADATTLVAQEVVEVSGAVVGDWGTQEAASMGRLPVGMAAGHLVLGALVDMDLLPVEDLGDSPTEGATVEATEATSNARVLGSKTGIRSGLGIDRNGRPSTGKTEVMFRIKVTFVKWYSMMIDGETCCAVLSFLSFLLSPFADHILHARLPRVFDVAFWYPLLLTSMFVLIPCYRYVLRVGSVAFSARRRSAPPKVVLRLALVRKYHPFGHVL